MLYKNIESKPNLNLVTNGELIAVTLTRKM